MRRRYLLVLLLSSFIITSAIAYIVVKLPPAFAQAGTSAYASKIVRAAAGIENTSVSPQIGSCDDLMVLLDKTHGLPENYAPPDRVHLADYSIPVTQSAIAGRLIMVGDLQKLFADSTNAGVDLKVVSAYRSYSLQASIYASYVQQYGADQANRFSAPPGHSQHQLGTAIDFSTDEIGYTLSQSFANTKAGQWLLANAYKYGFYLSYPEGQESITGYEFEPWHFRYLGVQNASKLKLSGMIMQTYLQQYGVIC
jgi:D-alanyl-D-alanine carboxypeptidase